MPLRIQSSVSISDLDQHIDPNEIHLTSSVIRYSDRTNNSEFFIKILANYILHIYKHGFMWWSSCVPGWRRTGNMSTSIPHLRSLPALPRYLGHRRSFSVRAKVTR